ncbi:Hydra magnipapillata [Seminavis robusta]|uniref:Hydra magnipapillata n=1 Tax=Seminavis robusta TaxID=568900 RepID=A0A9N8H2Y1_9STRA|nr:Hydra magnipapillata [Seminavis robusta]|eukprot:Sro26_g017910.1 Hydra magnipapillata (1350) ;mRNA; r:151849-155965
MLDGLYSEFHFCWMCMRTMMPTDKVKRKYGLHRQDSEKQHQGFCCLICNFFLCSQQCAATANACASKLCALFSIVHDHHSGALSSNEFLRLRQGFCAALGLEHQHDVAAVASARICVVMTKRLLERKQQELNLEDLGVLSLVCQDLCQKILDKAQQMHTRRHRKHHTTARHSPSLREARHLQALQSNISNLVKNYNNRGSHVSTAVSTDNASVEPRKNEQELASFRSACCLFNRGRFEEAEQMYVPFKYGLVQEYEGEKTKALDKAGKVYALGLNRFLEQDFDSALLEHRRCLRHFKEVMGLDHLVTTIVWTQIVILEWLKGSEAHAQADHQSIVEVQTKLLGRCHPFVQSTELLLKCARHENCLENKAHHIPSWFSLADKKHFWLLDEYRKCLGYHDYGAPGPHTSQASLEAAHKTLMGIRSTLSALQTCENLPTCRITEFQEIVAEKRHLHDEARLLKASALYALAAKHESQGKPDMVLSNLQQCKEVRKDIYGKDDVMLSEIESKVEETQARVKKLSTMAVSVYHLKTAFIKDLCAAGYGKSNSIYEIEDLRGPPGFIRQKGEGTVCPLSGELGSSYVHACKGGADNVGSANYMLSYSWKYSVGDIIDTLDSFCKANKKNPKRTYVWICFLCVNQWRVVKQSELELSGTLDTADFFTIFGDRVASIGHILAMMTPWYRPTYLERIWCIFEIFTAHRIGCNVSLVMPPSQRNSLEHALFGKKESGNLDAFYDVLSKTRVQNAQASVDKDRAAILEMIGERPGYAVINRFVNELMRQWLGGAIAETVATWQQVGHVRHRDVLYSMLGQGDKKRNDRLAYATFCTDIGLLFERNGEHESALNMQTKSLTVRESVLGKRSSATAESHCHLGCVLKSMGKYKEAASEFEKSLSIVHSSLDKDHLQAATVYTSFGVLLCIQGNYDLALKFHRKALAIYKKSKKSPSLDVATEHDNIGSALFHKAEYRGAFEEYRSSLRIRQSNASQQSSVETTISLKNIARVHQATGKFDEALSTLQLAAATLNKSVAGTNGLEKASILQARGDVLLEKGSFEDGIREYQEALDTIESILGDEHPDTAVGYHKMGLALQAKGDFDSAMTALLKGKEIRVSRFGSHHPDVADSKRCIGILLHEKGVYSSALSEFEEALKLSHEATSEGKDLRKAAIYGSMGSVLCAMGKFDSAEGFMTRCLDMEETVLGKIHPTVSLSLHSLGSLLFARGPPRFDEAMSMHKRALAIREAIFERDHPLLAESFVLIAPLSQAMGDFKHAEDLIEKACGIRERVFGKSHPWTIALHKKSSELKFLKSSSHHPQTFHPSRRRTSRRDPANLVKELRNHMDDDPDRKARERKGRKS